MTKDMKIIGLDMQKDPIRTVKILPDDGVKTYSLSTLIRFSSGGFGSLCFRCHTNPR